MVLEVIYVVRHGVSTTKCLCSSLSGEDEKTANCSLHVMRVSKDFPDSAGGATHVTKKRRGVLKIQTKASQQHTPGKARKKHLRKQDEPLTWRSVHRHVQ